MKKRFLALALAVVMTVLLLSVCVLAGGAAGTVSVTVSSFETGSLGSAIDAQLGSTARNDVTDLTVSGGVLNAADWATMKNMTGLVRVDLSGATCVDNEIPTEAFNNYNSNNPTEGPKYKLTTLVFPSGITTIQNGAFAFCKNLTFSSANWLPETVTTINPLAFQDCSAITSVDLSHVTTLGRQAFQRTGLTGTLTLPDNLLLVSNKSVSNFYIFDGCTGITEIVIGNGIKSKGTDCTTPAAYLGGNLFSGTSVTKLTIPGDITYLGSLGSVTGTSCELEVKSGVQYFGYYPTDSGMKEIDGGVVGGAVTKISLPDSITRISEKALLESIPVSKLEYHGTATGAGKMTLIDRGTTYLETIDLSGSGTTEFSTNGKAAEGKLKTIDLSSCTALTSVSVASWRTEGGVMNLLGCTALSSVTLGSNTDGSWCENYTLLLSSKPDTLSLNGTTGVDKGIALVTNGGTFPENTTFSYSALATPTKAGCAFAGWYENADFTGEAATTATKGKVYYAKWLATNGTCGVSVNWTLTQNNTDAAHPTYTLTISGEGAMANYTGASEQPWNAVIGSITKIVVENGVTAIGDWAFMNAENAVTVTLPEGLGKIGQRAFANCHKLQSPTFPSTLTEIGANPFYACNAFDTIVLPDGLTTMGEMLFYECTNLRSITIPANATSLPNEFVKGCAKLESIQIPASITGIGQSAFAGTGLKEITIPATVTTLNESLFYGCSSLEKVTFEGSAKVQSATFGNCTKLKMIVFTAANFDIHYEVNNPVFHTGSDKCVIILANSGISAESIAAVNNTLQEKVGGHTDASPAIALVLRGGTITGEAWGDAIATPTRAGYSFGGWYENADFTGEAVTSAAAGKVYYAKWVKEITFDSNGAPVYTVPTWPVTLSTGAHGSVTASATRASSGSAVVLTVEPKTGYKLDSLLIVDENGRSVAVTQRADGRYSFVMPDCGVSVTTRFLAENWLNPFTDVTAADWYYDAVSWACQSGVATGTSATSFSPNDSCTRAQLVTLLWRAAGEPEPASKVNPFGDVAYNSYYKKAVLWAVEQGITTGTSATTFSPEETCTRAEAVTFLFRYAAANGMDAVTLQELVSGYADAASVPGYSLSAFNWALASKLVQGAGGKLLPNDSCTRAQIVTILHRFFG